MLANRGESLGDIIAALTSVQQRYCTHVLFTSSMNIPCCTEGSLHTSPCIALHNSHVICRSAISYATASRNRNCIRRACLTR